MLLFFQCWVEILQLSMGFIVLILLTILGQRKSNPLGYQMGWAHFVIFVVYSLFFAFIDVQAAQKTGNGGATFALEMTIMVIITPVHLLIYWISLFMVKPNTIPQLVHKTSTQKDPILDEQPPKQS